MGRAAWHIALPSGAKLVLLCIISHYNDARGCAFPSLARLARMCGLHKRTVQTHITLLVQKSVLQVAKNPRLLHPMCTASTRLLWPRRPAQQTVPAVQKIYPPRWRFLQGGGDFYGQRAEITTQNGSNGIQQKKTTEPPTPAKPCLAPPPHKGQNHLRRHRCFCNLCPAQRIRLLLQAWQQVRRASAGPPCPMRCNANNCSTMPPPWANRWAGWCKSWR